MVRRGAEVEARVVSGGAILLAGGRGGVGRHRHGDPENRPGDRHEAGGDQRTIYRSRVGAGGESLDPLLRTLLRRNNGKLLRELGYLPA